MFHSIIELRLLPHSLCIKIHWNTNLPFEMSRKAILYALYRPLRARTIYVHSDLPWQKRVTDILIISSQWKHCIVIGIYLEIINIYICRLLCFVMVGQNRHNVAKTTV